MGTLKFKKSKFGTLYNGQKAHLFTISNGNMNFCVSDYGCTITSVMLCDKNRAVDVLLGCSTLEGYAKSPSCFGTVVGRFANRIGGAKFTLDGITYNLDKNDGENSLHGGFDRYEKKLWNWRKVYTSKGLGVEFSRLSCDGEQGMPGNVEIKVVYTLNESNELTLEYFAQSDKATPINLTNHAYFNLKGYDGGSIEDLELQMDCSYFVEVDSTLIPTGKLSSVAQESAFDFRTSKLIGKDMKDVGDGYDHAYCIDDYDGSLRKFCVLRDPKSGRSMSVSTTLPACQVYTGNFIEGVVGKNGFVHHIHDAVCLETEFYPDSPNHLEFPSCIVTPDKPYHQITVYRFAY